ncbi:MAG: hypothetical protein WA110_00490 [Anaerolineaceae bacterium]
MPAGTGTLGGHDDFVVDADAEVGARAIRQKTGIEFVPICCNRSRAIMLIALPFYQK